MKYLISGIIILSLLTLIVLIYKNKLSSFKSAGIKKEKISQQKQLLNPLSIEAMRQKSYPGSNIIVERTLEPGSNYSRYIVSYKSDGLKIYALLTVPDGNKPKTGWPVIVFKPDYRGNGQSEGKPEGAYYSPAYAVDDLNAIASIKKYPDADKNKIGLWGHSMGGNITLRDLVVDRKDIKAAVIWSGVVGSYDDLMNNWQRKVIYQPPPRELALRNNYRQNLVQQYGTPKSNPEFWNQIDPTYFIKDINIPIQLHHGLEDEEVPVLFSESLFNKLKRVGKTVEYYTYPGADHNISEPSFSIAMNRSVDFFNKYLK